MNKRYEISYAYPSSPHAITCGAANSGCFVLEVDGLLIHRPFASVRDALDTVLPGYTSTYFSLDNWNHPMNPHYTPKENQ